MINFGEQLEPAEVASASMMDDGRMDRRFPTGLITKISSYPKNININSSPTTERSSSWSEA
jgi:hypothetical protein